MAGELVTSRLDAGELVNQDVGVDHGANFLATRAATAFVLQAVRPSVAPDAERILPFPHTVRVQVVRHRPPDSLRARHARAATEFAEPLNLLFREIYDSPHGM